MVHLQSARKEKIQSIKQYNTWKGSYYPCYSCVSMVEQVTLFCFQISMNECNIYNTSTLQLLQLLCSFFMHSVMKESQRHWSEQNEVKKVVICIQSYVQSVPIFLAFFYTYYWGINTILVHFIYVLVF